MPLNAYDKMPRPSRRVQSSLIKLAYLKNEIITVSASMKKLCIYCFLRCSRWNVLIRVRYLCKVFLSKNDGKIKGVENVTIINKKLIRR